MREGAGDFEKNESDLGPLKDDEGGITAKRTGQGPGQPNVANREMAKNRKSSSLKRGERRGTPARAEGNSMKKGELNEKEWGRKRRSREKISVEA